MGPAPLLPPRYVEYRSLLPAALSLVTKTAEPPPPLRVGKEDWKAPVVVAKSGDDVLPVI
jgi:hypothetical protein